MNPGCSLLVWSRNRGTLTTGLLSTYAWHTFRVLGHPLQVSRLVVIIAGIVGVGLLINSGSSKIGGAIRERPVKILDGFGPCERLQPERSITEFTG